MDEPLQPKKENRRSGVLKSILFGKEGIPVALVSWVTVGLAFPGLYYTINNFGASKAAAKAAQDSAAQVKVTNYLTLMNQCLEGQSLPQYLSARFGVPANLHDAEVCEEMDIRRGVSTLTTVIVERQSRTRGRSCHDHQIN